MHKELEVVRKEFRHWIDRNSGRTGKDDII